MTKWCVFSSSSSSSNSGGLCGGFGFINLSLGRRNVGLSLFMAFADINKNTENLSPYPYSYKKNFNVKKSFYMFLNIYVLKM